MPNNKFFKIKTDTHNEYHAFKDNIHIHILEKDDKHVRFYSIDGYERSEKFNLISLYEKYKEKYKKTDISDVEFYQKYNAALTFINELKRKF